MILQTLAKFFLLVQESILKTTDEYRFKLNCLQNDKTIIKPLLKIMTDYIGLNSQLLSIKQWYCNLVGQYK